MLDGDIGEVGRVVAFAVVGKGNADAVGAEGPVEGVRGRGEVGEEGEGGGEDGEFGAGDGGEAVVFKGTVYKRDGGTTGQLVLCRHCQCFQLDMFVGLTRSERNPANQRPAPALRMCQCSHGDSCVHSALILCSRLRTKDVLPPWAEQQVRVVENADCRS